MKKLLVLSLVLVGCNRQLPMSDPRTIHGIDHAFDYCVQRFEGYLGHSIGDVAIQFAAQQGNIVGECTVWGGQWKQIVVDPHYWNDEAEDIEDQCALLTHELGHCVLNRGHVADSHPFTDSSNNTWSVPVSFMYPYVFFSGNYPYYHYNSVMPNDWQYLKDYYYYEMFHPAVGSPTMSIGTNEEVHYTDTKTIFNH